MRRTNAQHNSVTLYKLWDTEKKCFLKNISKEDAIFTEQRAKRWLENRGLLEKLNITIFLQEIKYE